MAALEKKKEDDLQESYKSIYQGGTEEEAKRTYFKAPYLSEQPTPESYLEKVQDAVPLDQLKQVVESTHFDQNLKFAAVVV